MVKYEPVRIWGADFETTVEIQYMIEGRVRVYAWAVESADADHIKARGETIESFIDFFRNKKSIIYFHNLKFDGMYILDYLMGLDIPAYGLIIKDKPKEPHLECLIDGHGQFYKLIYYDDKTTMTFLDLYKKYKMPLETVAKIFGIPGKSELPLGYRPVGREVTDVEWERVEGDVRILVEAIKFQLANKLTGLTVASDAKQAYETLIGSEELGRRHPKLSYEDDQLLRPAYRGGWVYLNPQYQGDLINDVYVFDVNSEYPSIMSGVRGELLPRGMPRVVDEDYKLRKNEIEIWDITANLYVNKNKLPFIHYKNFMGRLNHEYVENEDTPMRLMLSTPDWELYKECYSSDIVSFNARYVFNGEAGQFKTYIDYWMGIKEKASRENNGGLRQLGKDMMNNLSGRPALNPDRTSKIPRYDTEERMIKFTTIDNKTDPWYVPTSIFITAWGRHLIVKKAMQFQDDFVYADTDSVHILNYDRHKSWFDQECHPTKLGMFGLENVWAKAKYLRSKAYMHENDSQREIKCGGLPMKAKEYVTFDNFYIGSKLDGKLAGKIVPGGYLLKETTFKIQGGERWLF